MLAPHLPSASTQRLRRATVKRLKTPMRRRRRILKMKTTKTTAARRRRERPRARLDPTLRHLLIPLLATTMRTPLHRSLLFALVLSLLPKARRILILRVMLLPSTLLDLSQVQSVSDRQLPWALQVRFL
jgi:hypothetical protein